MRRLGTAARAFTFLALLSFVTAGPAFAEKPRHAAMVLDANTGKVLYASHSAEPRYPASLTKMMTLYLVFEEIKRGRLSYNSRIKVSARAAAQPPSKLGLKPGSDIQLIDIIKVLVTKSANDMAVAIAEHIAGSEAAFARRMTERAHQLGMHDTTFRNASGLPDSAQTTTARDMLTLALHLYDDFPKEFRLFSLRSFTYGGKTYRTHNTLMKSFEGMDGIKTGYTRASGFNVVTSVRTKGRHVMGVVFGGKSAASRNAQMRALLKRALAKASTKKTRRPSPVLVAKPVPVPRPAKRMVAQPAPMPVQKPALPDPAPAVRQEPVPIEIVSVKPLRMTTPERPAPPLQKADATAPAQAQTVAAHPAPAPTVPPREAETVVAKAPRTFSRLAPEGGGAPTAGLARAPSSLNEQMAALISQTTEVDQAPGPAQLRAAAHQQPLTTGAPGRAPSTLNAQAQALTGSMGGAAALATPRASLQTDTPWRDEPKWHLRGPIQETGFAAAAYEVQIGVYATAEEAERRLASVRQRIPGLAAHAGLALPVQRGKHLIYRARFAGFAEASATAACREMRRQSIDCTVTRPD